MGVTEYDTYTLDEINLANEIDVVEALPVDQTIDIRNRCMNKTCDCFRCIKSNWKEILCLFSLIILYLGFFTTIFIFYILGSVYPEKWTFMSTNVSKGFYIFFIVFCIIANSTILTISFVRSHFWNKVLTRTPFEDMHPFWGISLWSLLTLIFCLIPFLTSDLLIKARYNNLCDGYIYSITGNTRKLDFYLDGNNIFHVNSNYNADQILNVATSNLLGTNYSYSMSLKDGISTDFDVRYNEKLKMNDYTSTSSGWYNNPMKMKSQNNEILIAQSPFDKDEVKFCINNYDINVLKTGVIFQIQNRMKTCRKCMESCQDECTLWLTRTVPHTSTTCSNGKCTTRTYYTTETYCARYRSYSECLNTRCRYPACVGMGM